jgi:hypothetical protein
MTPSKPSGYKRDVLEKARRKRERNFRIVLPAQVHSQIDHILVNGRGCHSVSQARHKMQQDEMVGLFNELKYTLEFPTPKEQKNSHKTHNTEVKEKLARMAAECDKVKY